jgi:hypothetical protein
LDTRKPVSNNSGQLVPVFIGPFIGLITRIGLLSPAVSASPNAYTMMLLSDVAENYYLALLITCFLCFGYTVFEVRGSALLVSSGRKH